MRPGVARAALVVACAVVLLDVAAALAGSLLLRDPPLPGLGNRAENVAAIALPRDGAFRFAVLGDPEERPSVTHALLHQAAAAGADFAVITGDIADRCAAVDFAHFLWNWSELGADARPTFTAIGNHDKRGADTALFARFFGPEWFSFVHGRVLFLFVNDNDPADAARCEEFVRGELAAHAGQFDRTALVMHKPAIDYLKKGRVVRGTQTGAWIERAFGGRPPDLVLAGHYHGYVRRQAGDTLHLVTGGGGGNLQGPNERYHMILVDVLPGEIRDSTVPLDGWPPLRGKLEWPLAVSAWPLLYGTPARTGATLVLTLALVTAAWALRRRPRAAGG